MLVEIDVDTSELVVREADAVVVVEDSESDDVGDETTEDMVLEAWVAVV